ncbi:hypothetical protein EVAR_11648_1 [Eumeta japonica]|uniref:Uncharacterized protein n=1 Tax=Eumeta variegata TaxID=151549 RepID=A0A4C1WXZ2_EUMVA|nr:hypothetical protein EVAR_11648_1 [Eumeta japonica]
MPIAKRFSLAGRKRSGRKTSASRAAYNIAGSQHKHFTSSAGTAARHAMNHEYFMEDCRACGTRIKIIVRLEMLPPAENGVAMSKIWTLSPSRNWLEDSATSGRIKYIGSQCPNLTHFRCHCRDKWRDEASATLSSVSAYPLSGHGSCKQRAETREETEFFFHFGERRNSWPGASYRCD